MKLIGSSRKQLTIIQLMAILVFSIATNSANMPLEPPNVMYLLFVSYFEVVNIAENVKNIII